MEEKEMTLEQIEAHIQNAKMEQFEVGSSTAASEALAPVAVLQKVCGVYKAIRPILAVIVNFPLIPESIKKAIRTFMGVMDGLCP